jgi:hypothetical protein
MLILAYLRFGYVRSLWRGLVSGHRCYVPPGYTRVRRGPSLSAQRQLLNTGGVARNESQHDREIRTGVRHTLERR